jgi:hypothetical protein
MKTFKKIVLWLFGVIVVLLVVFVGLNMSDGALQPEVQQVIQKKQSASEAEIKSYQYFLAIRAAPTEDPAVVGAAAYEQIKNTPAKSENDEALKNLRARLHVIDIDGDDTTCARAFCDKKALAAEAEIDDALLKKNAVILERSKKLTSLGEYANDLAPDPMEPNEPQIALMGALRMQLLEWNKKLAAGHFADVIPELERDNIFLRSPLKHNSTLLAQLVSVSLLKQIRTFFKKATDIYPTLAKKCDQACRDSFIIDANYEDAVTRQIAFEITSIYITMGRPIPTSYFDLTDIEAAKSTTAQRNLNSIFSFFLLKNKTINDLYADWVAAARAECIKSTHICESNVPKFSGNYIVNPTGTLLRYVFDKYMRSRQYQKLYKGMQILKEPI